MPRPEDRIAALQEEVEANPASRQFYQLGELLRRDGKAAKAVTVLQLGLLHHPRYVAAWVALGRAGLEASDPTVADDALRQALDLDPSNPVAWRLLGEALLAQEDRHAALNAMGMALSLAPGDEVLRSAVEALAAETGAPRPRSAFGDDALGVGHHAAAGDVFGGGEDRASAGSDTGAVFDTTVLPARAIAAMLGGVVFDVDPLPFVADGGPFVLDAASVASTVEAEAPVGPWHEVEIDTAGRAEPGPGGRRWDEVELGTIPEAAVEVAPEAPQPVAEAQAETELIEDATGDVGEETMPTAEPERDDGAAAAAIPAVSPEPEDEFAAGAEVVALPVAVDTMDAARGYIQEGRPEAAAETLERLLALDPEQQEARDLLSLVHDMMEPLPDELTPLDVRARKIAALQRWLAQLTLGQRRVAL